MAGAKTWGAFKDERELGGGIAESSSKLALGPAVKSARAGRVLVVDDEIAVGRTILRLLGERHDVVVANGGSEGARMLEEGAEFDVILCDMSMPEVNGMEVYARATACRPELGPRFVFMTGGTFNSKMREFLETSSAETIDKPFDLDGLRTLVRERIER
jgi:CheY-like chemotaxis protein